VERKTLDYYATPPSVSLALRDWMVANTLLNSNDPFLDPSAGDGAIIRAFRDASRLSEAHWSAIEIDSSHLGSLQETAHRVFIADALATDWFPANVIANPPFRGLDQFWQKIARHRATYKKWCACLVPTAWWHAQKRREYVRPDFILALGWRPSFLLDGGRPRNGTQDYSWCVLAPREKSITRWERIEKPLQF